MKSLMTKHVAIPSVRVSVFRPEGLFLRLRKVEEMSQSPQFGSRCFVCGREGGAGRTRIPSLFGGAEPVPGRLSAVGRTLSGFGLGTGERTDDRPRPAATREISGAPVCGCQVAQAAGAASSDD